MLSWKFYWIYRSIYPKWFSRLHFMVNHVAVTPKYKAISKKFHITKSTNTMVVIFVFLKYKWVPDAPGDPPSPLSPRCSAPLHFRTDWMSEIAMQAMEACFARRDGYYRHCGKREAVWRLLFYRWGQTARPVFGPQSQLYTCPPKFGSKKWERKTKCFTTPSDWISCDRGWRQGFCTSALQTIWTG